jgi:hypothetical protein
MFYAGATSLGGIVSLTGLVPRLHQPFEAAMNGVVLGSLACLAFFHLENFTRATALLLVDGSTRSLDEAMKRLRTFWEVLGLAFVIAYVYGGSSKGWNLGAELFERLRP